MSSAVAASYKPPPFTSFTAGTMSRSLNRKDGLTSLLLIKVYRNYGLSTKFIQNGLRHLIKSPIGVKTRWIIRFPVCSKFCYNASIKSFEMLAG